MVLNRLSINTNQTIESKLIFETKQNKCYFSCKKWYYVILAKPNIIRKAVLWSCFLSFIRWRSVFNFFHHIISNNINLRPRKYWNMFKYYSIKGKIVGTPETNSRHPSVHARTPFDKNGFSQVKHFSKMFGNLASFHKSQLRLIYLKKQTWIFPLHLRSSRPRSRCSDRLGRRTPEQPQSSGRSLGTRERRKENEATRHNYKNMWKSRLLMTSFMNDPK